MKNTTTLAGLSALLFALTSMTLAQQSMAEHVGAIKASLATSQATLRQYEWVETTVVSLKGEAKSNKQNSCYYAADGSVTKIPLNPAPPPEKKRGLRGKIAANKTEELTDYMQQAVGLVKVYVPPQPAQIQAAKDAGKVSMDVLEPNKRVRLNLRDYYKPGDTLGLEFDMANNRLLGLSVQTYLEDAKDAVSLAVQMAALPDGSVYAAAIKLDAPAKKVSVTVDNAGYRKKGT